MLVTLIDIWVASFGGYLGALIGHQEGVVDYTDDHNMPKINCLG